jgi:hypothetical protein
VWVLAQVPAEALLHHQLQTCHHHRPPLLQLLVEARLLLLVELLLPLQQCVRHHRLHRPSALKAAATHVFHLTRCCWERNRSGIAGGRQKECTAGVLQLRMKADIHPHHLPSQITAEAACKQLADS